MTRESDIFDWQAKSWLQKDEISAIMEMSADQKAAFDDLLTQRLPDIQYTGETIFMTFMTHKIDVQGHEPIRQRNYPTSPIIEQEMCRQVDKLLAAENN